jgi:GABA(A) receptor-associated protein
MDNDLSYKERVSLKDRIIDSNKIVIKYRNFVPVIILCDKELSRIIKKKKYLVEFNNTVGDLLCIIRNKITTDKDKAFFVFCDNSIVCMSQNMGSLYEKYKINNNITSKDDNFLYIELRMESTFGYNVK